MRHFKIAKTSESAAAADIPGEYDFIVKIAKQVSADEADLGVAIEKGIEEYKRLLEEQPAEFVEKMKVWHLRQYLSDQKTK